MSKNQLLQQMKMSLCGKLAIVTGAGSGIGRATCRLLARDGAKVIAADRNLPAAQETTTHIKTETLALELDVCSLNSIKSAIQTIIKHFKQPPSIVVNSAGITRDNYLLKMSEAEFEDVCSINLKGTFLVNQQFAQAMIEHAVAQDASIVNLSSIVAKINSIGQCNYAASKAGVISLTEVAAKEFGKFGIRVNAVLPGFINTPMTAVVPAAIQQKMLQLCPMQRYGEPDEVAEVIAFLASQRASYVNAAAFEVTGGLK